MTHSRESLHPSHPRSLSAFPVVSAFSGWLQKPMLSPLDTQIPVARHNEPHDWTTSVWPVFCEGWDTPPVLHVLLVGVCSCIMEKAARFPFWGAVFSPNDWHWECLPLLRLCWYLQTQSWPVSRGAAVSECSTVPHHSSERHRITGLFVFQV